MKNLNRLLYFCYYIKNTSSATWLRFLRFAAEASGKRQWEMAADCLQSVFRYNVSLLEYFQFRFYQMSPAQRLQWAGTGFMYEYQRVMNPESERGVLDDKSRFFKVYAPFVQHVVTDKEGLNADARVFEKLKACSAGKVVLKTASGKCGRGVEILPVASFSDAASLISYMQASGFSVAESYISQHDSLQALSPSAVNTVRIFTQLDASNRVHILGCRQRISVNCPVDNMAAGNLAAPIDDVSGIICGPAVYSDITRRPETVHPITGVYIVGFQVPYWQATLELVKRAALWQPKNRSIGWDVVITNDGPGLIEGNHDWCKLVLQLPDKTGRKQQLQFFQNQYLNNQHDLPAISEALV